MPTDMNRRSFSVIAAGVAVSALVGDRAIASPAANPDFTGSMLRQARAVFAEANSLGLYGLPSAPGRQSAQDLAINLSEVVDNATSQPRERDSDVARLGDRAGALLSEINRALKDYPEQPAAAPPKFDTLQSEYKRHFQAASPKPEHLPELIRAVKRMCAGEPLKRYRYVSNVTGLPWYMIACLHYREASLNFLGHLHNGDNLRLKTVQVPANRPAGVWPPEPWDAQLAWYTSASDALSRFGRATDWTLERMLYAFEAYNGWGYRYHPPARSPYLWNYTKFYDRGGYASDGKWSSQYISKQAGVVALLKVMKAEYPDLIKFDFQS